jgi:transposase-like protein
MSAQVKVTRFQREWERLKGLRLRRKKSAAQLKALASDTAMAARELHRRGLSLRDIAELVGTSHQRIQQWVSCNYRECVKHHGPKECK